MELFLKFDINFFSVLLLLVLYFTIKVRKEASGTSSHLFFRLLGVVVYLLILEFFSWLYDGVPGQNFLNYFFNMLFALSTSLATCVWASYIDYHIFASYKRLKARRFYCHPFVINALVLMYNIFNPIIFSVSPDNVYSREAGMMLLPIINLFVFFYICYLAYDNRRQIQREVILVMLLYVVMPVVAGFLQVMLFGVYILWPTMAVTVVLTYIFLETISTSKDYLTGLLSRQRIDSYLDYMLEQERAFTIVMMDLDNFKRINDELGHLSGDRALKVFSDQLLGQFKKEKVVGRYAGDEFVLIMEGINKENLNERMGLIKEELKSLYTNQKIAFQLGFSYGIYEYSGKQQLSYEQVMELVDQRMYANKELTREE